MFADIPARLRGAEFVRVRFFLEFQEFCHFGLETILRLRRDLHKTGRDLLGSGEQFSRLFEPPLPVDPVAVRRHQRPGPPFVLHPPDRLPEVFGPGDVLVLPVLFLGDGSQQLPAFIRVMCALGAAGVHRGEGRFELTAVEAEEVSGVFRPIWRSGMSPERLAVPIQDATWWLENTVPRPPVILEFLTPARLLADGRPLFRAPFSRLFPFFLRRVTSMLYAHCGIEVVDDPAPLLEAAAGVTESGNRLIWKDWRVLEGEGGRVDLGGLSGSIRLDGEGLGNILWVLQLGSLFNLGRGAAYGSGHPSLREVV
jgi:hypothetical protein